MLPFFLKRWFLISLSGLLIIGLLLGMSWSPQVKPIADAINPLVTTATILFLMSFGLDTRQLQAAMRFPLPVALGSLLNIGLAPSLGLSLMPLQGLPDFRYGLLAAACVPCTMAAASVWTRKARGNDAVSLLVTLVTNSASIVVIPFWLAMASAWFPLPSLPSANSSVVSGKLLDLNRTVIELLLGVLSPIILGQLLRQPAKLNAWAARHKASLSNLAQALILLMVWTAAVKGGVRIAQTQLVISPLSVAMVWASVIGVHLATLYVGLVLSRLLRIQRSDQIAVAFAGSQKTLPVGLLISDTLARQAGLSFAVFPMLLYHASQLFLDTVIADRYAAESPAPESVT